MPVLFRTMDFYDEVGRRLLAYTKANLHVGYKMGARTTTAGMIDCSGWAAEAVSSVFNHMNGFCGYELYDEKQVSILQAAAASQIQRIGEQAGFVEDADIEQGNLLSGTLIGIRRAQGGEWAAQRWNKISHIVVFIAIDGKNYASQSSGGFGVHLKPYKEWLEEEKRIGSHFFAVNPFKLIVPNTPDHLRLAITGLTSEKERAVRQACKAQGICGVYKEEASFLAGKGHVLVQVTRENLRYKRGEIVVVNAAGYGLS